MPESFEFYAKRHTSDTWSLRSQKKRIKASLQQSLFKVTRKEQDLCQLTYDENAKADTKKKKSVKRLTLSNVCISVPLDSSDHWAFKNKFAEYEPSNYHTYFVLLDKKHFNSPILAAEWNAFSENDRNTLLTNFVEMGVQQYDASADLYTKMMQRRLTSSHHSGQTNPYVANGETGALIYFELQGKEKIIVKSNAFETSFSCNRVPVMMNLKSWAAGMGMSSVTHDAPQNSGYDSVSGNCHLQLTPYTRHSIMNKKIEQMQIPPGQQMMLYNAKILLAVTSNAHITYKKTNSSIHQESK